MCGICGVAIVNDNQLMLDPARLDRMTDSLAHRGPDDRSVFIRPKTGLGHRRLSIVDVAGGRQPMSNEDGSVWVVFNGEIYNHRDIRPRLEQAGHKFRTSSDTETIIHLYEEIGDHVVEELRGMFAFAIFDENRQTILLARDRLGVKPLYYFVDDDGTLYFGSEIKSILEYGAIRARVNFTAVPDFLANRAPSGEQTLFDGIKRLLPAHTLIWNQGKVETKQYWSASFEKSEGLSERQYVERFSELFRESVKLRLMADVPLGMFLSGGIDSSAIAAVMSELVEEPIKTFSVAFAERDANELEYARLVAAQFGTDHHEVVVTPEQFFAALPGLVYQEDEPIAHPSSIPLYFVSDLASRHVKVVLTGEGSDELLAGYARYGKTVANLKLASLYKNTAPARLRSTVRELAAAALPYGIRRKLERTFLCLDGTLESLYFENFAVFGRSSQSELLSGVAQEQVGSAYPYHAAAEVIASSNAGWLLDLLLAADMGTYLQELLMKQDQMSMAASVESRVPFLDHRLVEFACALPARMKLSRSFNTKHILRRAMRGKLPEPILSRSKMGFPVPVGKWLAGPFTGLLDEYLLCDRFTRRELFNADYVRGLVRQHRAGFYQTEKLWMLVNFEIWMRRFIDCDNSADIEPVRQYAIAATAGYGGVA